MFFDYICYHFISNKQLLYRVHGNIVFRLLFHLQYVRNEGKVFDKALFINLFEYIGLVAIGCLLAAFLLVPTFLSIVENRGTSNFGGSAVDFNIL